MQDLCPKDDPLKILLLVIAAPVHYIEVTSDFESIVASFTSNTSLAAKGALAHRLQRHTACKIQNGRQGAPKWRTGSGKVAMEETGKKTEKKH